MPNTSVDAKLVKTWSVDGVSVKSAKVDSKPVFSSSILSVDLLVGSASPNNVFGFDRTDLTATGNTFGTFTPTNPLLFYRRIGCVLYYTDIKILVIVISDGSADTAWTSVTIGNTTVPKSAFSIASHTANGIPYCSYTYSVDSFPDLANKTGQHVQVTFN